MTPELGSAVWPEVEAAERRALVVPIGSCEQHGPHLPLDTDTRIAAAIATRVVEATDGAFRGPTIAIGASGEHADFQGTLSIGSTALELLVVELVRDACRHWPCVLLVNGHGGNVEALTAAVAVARLEGRRCGAWTAAVPGGDAHAGCVETSLLLALAPGLVRLQDAEAGGPRTIAELLPTLRAHGVRAVAPNGVLGDPTGASAEEGDCLLDLLTASCLIELHALLAQA